MGGFGSKYGSTVVRDHDLTNKVAIVTGPTSGIGYETSKMLASVGCHVVLAGRGQTRLASIATKMTLELSKSHPNITPRFTAIELDLTSFTSIDSFVTRFQQTNLPCHYLFNNAGVMMTDYSHTVDGFEMQLGTNCIGHQYFTNRLMPVLITSQPARVIWTSSELHMSNYDVKGGEDEIKNKLFPKQQDYDRMKWYTHSKLGNIYQAREIIRRYASQGVISIACHPGVVATELSRQTWYTSLFFKGVSWCLKNSNQGAATQLWLALDQEWPKHINEPNFSFYSKDCYIANTNKLGKDQTFGKLWYDVSDREITRVASQLGLPVGTSIPSASLN